MKIKMKMKMFVITISPVLFIALLVVDFVACIHFDQSIGGHLRRAADSNKLPLALEELNIAVKNMKDQQLTEGYTSILYKTPDEDIGFWYKNISQARDDLELNSKEEISSLEESNILIKLRETLLDGNNTSRVTKPAGIALYPYNGLLSLLYMFLGMFAIISCGILLSGSPKWLFIEKSHPARIQL